MTKFRGLTLAATLLALAASLIIGACGQDAEPEQTAVAQPIQAPSAQPPTPSGVDTTPTATPSPSPSPTAYARFPISRPTGFTPRSADPTPIPAPTTSPTPTRAAATVTATPTPATATPNPTASPTAAAAPISDDPDANLRIITLLPKDGIPAILEPTFIDATKAWDQYLADEPVLGVSINGEHKAYSVPYLSSREIVNDELGGVAIAATW